MIEVRRTDVFSRWIDQLPDDQAIARILTRIYRLSLGNFGDVKSVGEGVSELRIDYDQMERARTVFEWGPEPRKTKNEKSERVKRQ